MENTKTKVIATFKRLRKQGFICLANYMCCQSCAGYAIAERVGNMPKEKADKVKGAIFWHSQDEQDYQKNGRLSLAYGDLDTEQHGNIGLPTVETGRILATELQKEGLRVNWNGDASQRIEVLP